MKTLTLLLTMVVALVSLGARSDAAKDAENNETSKPKAHKQGKEPTTRKKALLRGMHARMAKVCKLSVQQQKQIAELNTLRKKAMKQFHTENAEEIKTLKTKLAEAKKNKDKKAMKEAMVQHRSLRVRQREIYTQWRSKIMAVLTPEQKSLWDKDQVMLLIKRRFKKVQLTDKQTVDVEAACAKFTAGVDLSDKKARRETVIKLSDYISKEILTDAQRAATTRPGKKKATTRPENADKPSKV
ncbi:MAG: hypothetical protein SVV80_12560 [Planctomycetota bacterium]|nr:hypothetical protein [Planctomycetota bacterium]